MKKGRILIVDDNKSVLTSLELLLEAHFSEVVVISNPNRIAATLATQSFFDVVLLDMNFTAQINNGNEGLYWLRKITEQAPKVRVIMLTAYGDVELAVKALKLGAFDFVLKPWSNDVLVEKIQSALTIPSKEEAASSKINASSTESTMLFGQSPSMVKLLKMVCKVAKTDANILITGENGTGKEMLAREIHRLSLRCKSELVTVDMGAIAESLFESELFGHEKGAFTDAKDFRVGKFEAAHRGTLFLDEIGNLPYSLQAKLLAALQNREVVRVGSNRKIPVDIRLIAATNKKLSEMVDANTFREDLYYRINTIQLEIPPLRSRRDDIPLFTEFFLKKYSVKYNRRELTFHPQAMEKLIAYSWPGNIRELQHTVEKAVILADGNTIKASQLDMGIKTAFSTPEISNLGEIERIAIEAAIQQNNGNMSAAAEQLGISRQTLYNKIKRYSIYV